LDKILEHVNHTSEISWNIKSILHPKQAKAFNAITCISNYFFRLPLHFLCVLASISRHLQSFSQHGFFLLKVVKFLTSLPVFLIQLSTRLSQLKFLGNYTESLQTESGQQCTTIESELRDDTGNPKTDSEQSNESFAKKRNIHKGQRMFIVAGNILSTMILDVLFGITLVYFICSSSLVVDITDNLISYTNYAAHLLTNLINWLMGVPGGLKLNRTLTNFLGKFFLYHIYLWQTYLQVIQPYLEPVLQVCILSGCLGMSFLISMASDVFSLLTLHIYFFYVYAARLYSLQIYAIISLARLFMG